MLPAGEVRIYLACGVTDMRKGFHSVLMGWTPPDGIDVPKWRC
jgi:hypothetical protein